ncbi:MAG: hypothetical protein LJE89_18105 [Deltaproteobacteria bacterium]|nr:hypothetical protein [Deltaproteobacteria bacterium]
MGERMYIERVLRHLAVIFVSIALLAGGCAGPGAISTHRETMGDFTEDEYFIPRRPVDNPCIGCAMSKQFGLIEDPLADDIRVREEESFNEMQEEFAKKLGLGFGVETIYGPRGGAGIEYEKQDETKMRGLTIIKPISLADIPFEPEVPYVIEALRLKGYKLSSSGGTGGSIEASADANKIGKGAITLDVGASKRVGLEGEGLVVAYRLQKIDMKSYDKKDSGPVSLELDKSVDFPDAGMVVKARLYYIEPGANKSLSRDILWACDEAEAKSRDMVAAWIVRVTFLDPKKKSLKIGFPAYPAVEDCSYFSSVLYSRIDPATDKIHREKIAITVVEAEVSDNLEPRAWDARVSVVTESFNIKPVSSKGFSG